VFGSVTSKFHRGDERLVFADSFAVVPPRPGLLVWARAVSNAELGDCQGEKGEECFISVVCPPNQIAANIRKSSANNFFAR